MTDLEFEAIIEEGQRGGALVSIPYDVEDLFGKRRVKVVASFDNVEYRGSIVFMKGKFILGIKKAIREEINKDIGDNVHIKLHEDMEPRIVEVPDYISESLTPHPEIKDKFENLSYTHKKEYLNWIEEAKKEETKKKRINQMIERLSQG